MMTAVRDMTTLSNTQIMFLMDKLVIFGLNLVKINDFLPYSKGENFAANDSVVKQTPYFVAIAE